MAETYKGIPQRRNRVEAQASRLYTDEGDNQRYIAYVAGSSTMASGATSAVVSGAANLQVSANSVIVITPTTSGASGTWWVEKTDPSRAYDHQAGGPVITGYGSFIVYSTTAQSTDINFDYIVSNASVITTTLSSTSAASGGVAFQKNDGSVSQPDPLTYTETKTAGTINDGSVTPEDPMTYTSTKNL